MFFPIFYTTFVLAAPLVFPLSIALGFFFVYCAPPAVKCNICPWLGVNHSHICLCFFLVPGAWKYPMGCRLGSNPPWQIPNTISILMYLLFEKEKKRQEVCFHSPVFMCIFYFGWDKRKQHISKAKQQNAMKEEENKSIRIFIFITYTIYNT